jgi:hypothetical protein
MEQKPSKQAKKVSRSQKIARVWSNSKVHCRVRHDRLLFFILCKNNPTQAPSYFKIHFNIIFPYNPHSVGRVAQSV